MAWNDYFVADDSAGGDGSQGDPWTWSEMMAALSGLGGTEPVRVNIKGSFNFGSSMQDFSGMGYTLSDPLYLRGCSDLSTPNDGGLTVMTSTATTAIKLSDSVIAEGLDFSCIGSVYCVDGGNLYRCRLAIDTDGNSVVFDNCRTAHFCLIHSKGGPATTKIGIRTPLTDSLSRTISRNLILMDDACTEGINLQHNLRGVAIGNILRGMGDGVGISRPSSDRNIVIDGNVVYDFDDSINVPSGNYDLSAAIVKNICFKGTNGIVVAGSPIAMILGNAVGEMTTARYDYANDLMIIGDIVLGTEVSDGCPFVDPANGDFSLDENTINGQRLIDAGFPRIVGFDYTTMTPTAHPSGNGNGGVGGVSLSRVFGGL